MLGLKWLIFVSSVKSGQVRNIESARISMPGQTKNSVTNEPATLQILDPNKKSNLSPTQSSGGAVSTEKHSESTGATGSGPEPVASPPALRSDAIIEEENEEAEPPPSHFLPPPPIPAAANTQVRCYPMLD